MLLFFTTSQCPTNNQYQTSKSLTIKSQAQAQQANRLSIHGTPTGTFTYLSVSFCTCVGDDDFGRWLWFLSKLRDEGLLESPDRSIVVLAGVPQSTCVVLSGAADRAMVSCYSSNRRMRAEDFEGSLLGGVCRHLHIGGCAACSV